MTAGTLLGLLEAQARRDPGAPAILAPGRAPLAYGRLHAEVLAVARALGDLGIGRGDRVALVLENGPEAAVAFLGVAAAATCAALNPAYLEGELDFYLDALKVDALILPAGAPSPARAAARKKGARVIELSPSAGAEAGVFSLAGEATREASGASGAGADLTGPDDVALVLHTSGTTSRPKIVPLSQRSLHAAARAMAEVLALGPADRCLNVMPLFHIHGLSTVYASMAAGASVVCPPPFDAQQLLGWVEAFSPTWTTAAPTLHRAILDAASQRPEVLARHPFRFLRSASAAMPPRLIEELERLFRAPFIEAYGMTEACPPVASNRLPPGERKPGSVGPATRGTEIAILGEASRLLPAGERGEVVLRGVNVMRGYEDDPAANEAAFVDGWLRTGDEGYLDEGGYLFITGRTKEIINRGGEKIAPREVDEALLEHPAVAEAVAFAVPHPRLGEDVAAAVVLRPGRAVTPRELQAFVAARLADFKVPRPVVIVPGIPRGATGKIQRVGLADKLGLGAPAAADEGAASSAPRTETEALLAALWARALKAERVGVHDDLFRLGGDSLLAARILAEVREALGVTLKLHDVFLAPTVAELARHVEIAARASAGQGSAPIPRLPPSAAAPLSFVQESFWFLDQLDPQNAAYNVYRAARLEGPLDTARLERSIQAIVRRHEILRTTFPTVDGRPRRAVAPAAAAQLARVDLRALPPEERRAEAERRAVEEAGEPFDLGAGPLFRAALLLLDEEEHVLLITAHHAVFDLFSLGIFFQELGALYAASGEGAEASSGAPPALPELPIQHGDFAAFQRQQGALFAQQLAYWKEQLAGLPPPLELPTDRPRGAARTFRGARRFFQLPPELARDLVALCRREGVTLFMALLTAFDMLLARVTGQRDIVVGSPIAGRNRAEVEGLIGVFSNTLVFRVDLADNPSFRRALARVREVALGAYAHQDLPFDQLVEGVKPSGNRARMPLFQVNFRVQSDPVAPDVIPGLQLRFLKLSNQMAKFDLALELSDTPEGLGGFFEYRTDLFDPATIERLLADLVSLLAAAVRAPDTALSDLPVSLQPRAAEAKAPAPPRRPEAPKLKSLRDARRRAVDLPPGSPEERAPVDTERPPPAGAAPRGGGAPD